MVNASIEMPVEISNFLVALQDKAQNFDSKSQVDELIKILKSAIDYRSQIEIKPFDIGEKFKGVKTTAESDKNKIYELGLKLLFGSNCQEPENVDLILANEFKVRKNILADALASELNAAFQALYLIPHPQRTPQSTKNFIALFKGVNKAEQIELSQFLKTISNDLLSVVSLSAQLLKDTQDGNQKLAILKAVNKIALSDRQNVIENSQSLSTDINEGNQIAALVTALSEIPSEDRQDVIYHSLPLLKNRLNGKQRADILCAVGSIEFENRRAMIAKSTPLMKDILDGTQCAEILKAVNSIKPSEFQTVLKLSIPLLKGIVEGQATIITAVGKLHPSYRAEIIKQLMPLLKGITHGSELADIIDFVRQEVPLEEREDIIKLTARFSQGKSPSFRLLVFKKFNQMSIGEIEDFIKLAYPLIRRFKEENSCTVLINLIFKLPYEEREETIQLLTPVLRGSFSSSELSSILSALIDTPANEREDVLRKAAPLLLTSKKDQWGHLIDDLKNVHYDEREHVIKYSKLLFHKPGFRGSVIRIVNQIQRHEREYIIKLTAPLCNKIELCNEHANILQRVYKLAPEERESIVKNAFYLVKDANDYTDVINIIKALEDVPRVERKDAAAKLAPYLTKISSITAKMSAIKALANIPKEKRETFLERCWNIAQEYAPDQNMMLYAILSVPEDKWEAVKKIAAPLHKDIKNVQEIAYIIYNINSLLLSEREIIVKFAEPFLNKDINGYGVTNLINAIKEMPSNIRERVLSCFILFRDITVYELQSILKFAVEIPENELKDYISQTLLLSADQPNYSTQSKVFSLIHKIPVEHRQDAITCSLPLLSGFDAEQRIAITIALCEIPQDQRSNLVAQLLPLIKGVNDHTHVIEMIKTLFKIKIEERQDVISNSLPLIMDVKDGKDRALIMLAVSEMQQAERPNIIKQSGSLLKGITQGFQKAEVLKLIHKSSPDKRADIISRTLAFSKIFKDPFLRVGILNLASKIPAEKWAQVIETAKPLFDERDGCFQITYLLENVHIFLEKHQEGIIARCLPLLNELSEAYEKIDILKLLVNVPEEQLNCILSHLIPLIKKSKYSPRELCKAVMAIPEDQIGDVITKAAPLTKRVLFGKECADILNSVWMVPSDQRDRVVSKALLLMQGIKQGDSTDNRCVILKAVTNIPQDEMEDVLSKAIPLTKGIVYAYMRADIIRAITAIPKEERANVILNAAPLFINVKYKIAGLLTAVAQFPRIERSTILKQLAPLFEDIKSDNLRAEIIIAWSGFPQDQRAAIVPQAFLLFKQLKDSRELSLVFESLQMVEPSKRDLAIKIFFENPLFKNKTIYNIFNSNEEIRIASHEYLSRLLDEALLDPQKGFRLAARIFASADDLMLHQEHPLFQKSIEIQAVTDPDALNNRKNPYKIFQDLKKLLATENLLPYLPEASSVSGEKIAIDVECLRKRANRKGFTIGDLPKDVSSDTFDKLYSQLEKRLKELPYQKRVEVERYISDCFIRTVKELKESFLGKPLIKGLLSVRGSSSQQIESTVFYLYVLMKAIMDVDSNLGKLLLSPQEELLLRVSYSINECATGQRDGIANYYNRLAIAYRQGRDKEALWGPEEKVANLVDHSVQKHLTDVFSDDELLKEITKLNHHSQTPHQVFYLKNRLHLQVGLAHRLVFDPHTGMILDKILEAELLALMDAYFKFCTVEKMMAQLKRDVTESLVSKGIVFMDLLYFMESHILKELNMKKLDPENYSKYFDLDDNCKPLGITDEGACIILKAIGYLCHAQELSLDTKLKIQPPHGIS